MSRAFERNPSATDTFIHTCSEPRRWSHLTFGSSLSFAAVASNRCFEFRPIHRLCQHHSENRFHRCRQLFIRGLILSIAACCHGESEPRASSPGLILSIIVSISSAMMAEYAAWESHAALFLVISFI